MKARVEISENIAIIVLDGQLDYSSQDDIHDAINTVLASSTAKEIQVDLYAVTFMDSAIIQALLTLRKKALKVEKLLTLTRCPDTLREIFTIGGFDGVFTIK